jgi:hypothetical protein
MIAPIVIALAAAVFLLGVSAGYSTGYSAGYPRGVVAGIKSWVKNKKGGHCD